MAEALTESDTFDTSVTVPQGGDPRNAASIRPAFQSLANRTRRILNLLGGNPAAVTLASLTVSGAITLAGDVLAGVFKRPRWFVLDAPNADTTFQSSTGQPNVIVATVITSARTYYLSNMAADGDWFLFVNAGAASSISIGDETEIPSAPTRVLVTLFTAGTTRACLAIRIGGAWHKIPLGIHA